MVAGLGANSDSGSIPLSRSRARGALDDGLETVERCWSAKFRRRRPDGGIVLFSISLLWGGGKSLGQFAGYWKELDFVAQEQVLVIRRRGWGFWGNRTTTILFAQLKFVNLRVDAEDRGPFLLHFTLHYRDRKPLRILTMHFEVFNCHTRAQVLEFLWTLGRFWRPEVTLKINTARVMPLGSYP